MDPKLSLEAQLEGLLNEDIASVVEREQTAFDRLTEPFGKLLVLFGAGNLGRKTLTGLRKVGIEPLAFADNNPNMWDTEVDGLRVFSPQQAVKKFGAHSVFVVTIYTSAPVHQQLNNMGLKVISFPALAWKFPNTFLPHCALDLPQKIFEQAVEIRNVLNYWSDDESSREYLAQLEWRTSLASSALPPHLPPEETYFPGDIYKYLTDEVFVDCGAFSGDTIQSYIKHQKQYFSKIIAVEPDPINCRLFKEYVSGLPNEFQTKIEIKQYAVGSKRERVQFTMTGSAASSVGTGEFYAESVPLDDLLGNDRPTLIKMDIEGAELDALIGAKRTICQHLPVLAICLYHRQDDLWLIPSLIKSYSESYNLFLRRYSDECWELVCYAVPDERLIGQKEGKK
jgi:FkbM family methyltransferase